MSSTSDVDFIVTIPSYVTLLIPHYSVCVFLDYFDKQYFAYVSAKLFVDRISVWVNMLKYSSNHTLYLCDRIVRFGDWSPAESSITKVCLPAPHMLKVKKQKRIPIADTYFQNWLKQLHISDNKKYIVYRNIKHIAHNILCTSCGYRVMCRDCSGTMYLQQSTMGNVFVCRQCSHTCDSYDQCPVCDGFTLLSAARGLVYFANTAREVLGEHINIYTLTAETKSLAKLIAQFEATGGILFTTAALFSHTLPLCDDIYVTLGSWEQYDSEFPEMPLWQYSRLANISKRVSLTQETADNLLFECEIVGAFVDIAPRYRFEQEQSKKHSLHLPCTLW